MIAIRGVYDGKTFSALPSEPLPQVQRAIPVAIVFLEEVSPRWTNANTKWKLLGVCVPPAKPCHRWV